MLNSKNKIIEMQAKTIKNQEDIIFKKNLKNLALEDCFHKIKEEIAKADAKKIPFAIVVSNINELVTDVENHN